jgi:pimeloyl-ACP methyl ester carboxylesterase
MSIEQAPAVEPAEQVAQGERAPRRRRLRRWLRRIGIGLAAFIVLLTAASFAYNLATDGRERPASALYAGPFVRVAGTEVAYRQWGSAGTPILLLGGFAEPTWVWQDVAPVLARDHRVVAIDLPPFGYTQRGGDPSLTSWTRLTDGAVHALHLSRPLVVGHSLGAGVAASLAISDPGDVSGIVFLDGDGLAGGGGGRGVLSDLLIDPFYTSAFRLLTGSDFVVSQILERALGPSHPPITRSMLNGFERPFLVQGTASEFRRLAGRGIIGVTPADLTRVPVPATVVWGQHDEIDAIGAGRRSAAALHAPFIVIPGAGHLSMLVRPAAVAAAIARAAGPR